MIIIPSNPEINYFTSVKENYNFALFSFRSGSHNAVAVAARGKVEGNNAIVVSRGIPSHIR